MDNSKNEDIFKLISQILEYTDNPTGSSPSDPSSPTPSDCKCKAEGGDCGDDINVDCPEVLFPKESLCLCEDDPLKKCPVCPVKTPCLCKTEGGDCGDDPQYDCPDAIIMGAPVLCFCADEPLKSCQKCPPPTPTECYCFDCGYSAYDYGGCISSTCQAPGCSPKRDCYDCSSPTPTPSCNSSGDPCPCDSGTNCDNCAAPDFECVNQTLKTCPDGCIINCGSCEPTTTDTPPETPTNTKLCPCDCSLYKTLSECENAKRRYCRTGRCECRINPCGGNDCQTNYYCADLIIDPTPTPPTATNTCPTECSDAGCFNNANCNGRCVKTGNDYKACCNSATCGFKGCPVLLGCYGCFHQPNKCKEKKGYSTKGACENGLDLDLWICKDNGEQGDCGYESCFVPEPVATNSLTPCDCQNYQGCVDVGHCGAIGVCFPNFGIICPDGKTTIECDICCSPTPTDTCSCDDYETCWDYGPDCQTAKEETESQNPLARCTCSNKPCASSNRGKTCVCMTCTYITPTPETVPPTCLPRPSDCCYYPVCNGHAYACQKCREWTEPRKVPGDDPRCPAHECAKKEITNSLATTKDLGYAIPDPATGKINCARDGRECTTATRYSCNEPGTRYYVYSLQTAKGPLDGVTNC